MIEISKKQHVQPTVLEHISLPDIIQHVLNHHASPTTLIVCSTREAFLEQLLYALQAASQSRTDDRITEASEASSTSVHPLLLSTLHLLATSRTINVVFCPDLGNLQAYLSVLPFRHSRSSHASTPNQENRSTGDVLPLLTIINPIQLHKHTSSFSAQGLNRTFAAAVDCAYLSGRKLILVECRQPGFSGDEAQDAGAEGEGEHLGEGGANETPSPWDEQVSILNVTTKSFGAGERGWVGRTVRIKTVAERWCVFQKALSD